MSANVLWMCSLKITNPQIFIYFSCYRDLDLANYSLVMFSEYLQAIFSR